MVFSPKKSQNKSLEEMTNQEAQQFSQTGYEPPPDDYFSYDDDGYAPPSNESDREPLYDIPADAKAQATNNPVPETPSRFVRNKATTNTPAQNNTGNSSSAFSPSSAPRFVRNKVTDTPAQNNTGNSGAAFSPSSAPRFVRNKVTDTPAQNSTGNNSTAFGRNNVRNMATPIPTATPVESSNNIANNQDTPQGVQRFNRSNHSSFADKGNSTNAYSNNRNNFRPTTASQALSNFKPASSPYEKGVPSAAYLAKLEAKNLNMRVSSLKDLRKTSLLSYPKERLLFLSKSFEAPSPQVPAQSNSFYEQPIPARANAGFRDDLDIPEKTNASFNPAPKTASNNKAFLNKNNQQQQREFQSQMAPAQKAMPIKDDSQEASEIFSTGNVNNEENNKFIKTDRFKLIPTLELPPHPISLEEAFIDKIAEIDHLQQEIINNFKRLNPDEDVDAILNKKKKTRKTKAEKEAEEASNKVEADNSATPVANEADAAQPVTRKKNQTFHPKSIIEASSFEDVSSPKFEGENLKDLEKSFVSTKELLNISTIQLSPGIKFNTQELSAIPPESLLSFLGANKVENDNQVLYQLGDNLFDISNGSNKWYNKTMHKGSTGTINLMKHLIAIENNIIENENNSDLFKAACMKLVSYQAEINAFISKNNEDLEAKKKLETQAFFRAIDMIPLEDIMIYLGARNNHKGASGRWKVPQNGQVYSINKGWYSFTSSEHGNGAISLFAHAIAEQEGLYYKNEQDYKKLFKIAVNTLKKAFEQEINLNINIDFNDLPKSFSFNESFYMPIVIPFKQNSVANYLNQKRGIPMWIINKQFASGLLYPGFPSDWQRTRDVQFNDTLEDKNVWAVFLGANANAAEMRAIDRYDGTAKLQAKGSSKEHGGHVVKAEKEFQEYTVCSFEAAIDALSYHALHPGRTTNSCMGVNYNLAVKIAIEALDNDYNYNLCFDNDLAGNLATLKFKEELIFNIGEEDYNYFYNNNKIEYFELGIHCYNKQVSNGKPFYLDNTYDDNGKLIFKMFSQELLKFFEKEDILSDMKNGLFYFYNITPKFELIRHDDIENEAKKIANTFLNENKPFYFVTDPPELSISNYDSPEIIKEKELEHEENLMKHQAFLAYFKLALGEDKWIELEEKGAIIPHIKNYAKDWNEFVIKEQANNPEVASTFAEREEFFKSVYTEDVKIAEVAGKIRRKP